MNYKSILLLVIIGILFISSVIGIDQYPYVENPLSADFFKPLDELAGTDIPDLINVPYTGTIVNGEGDEWQPMVINNGIFINGDNEYIDTKFPISTGVQAWTYCLWMNVSSVGQPHTSQYMMGAQQDGTLGYAFIHSSGSDDVYIRYNGGGQENVFYWRDSWDILINGTPNYICVRKDSGTNAAAFSIFLNSVEQSLDITASNNVPEGAYFSLFVGVTSVGDLDVDTRMMADELIFFNRSISDEDIETLFLGNYAADPPTVTQINHTSDDAVGTTCPSDLTLCANTRAGNPSFDVILDVAGRVRFSTEDLGYDDMPSNNNCTGADTTSLSCTFPTNIPIGVNRIVYFATLLTSDATANNTELPIENKANMTITKTMYGWVNDFLHQPIAAARIYIIAKSTFLFYGNTTTNATPDSNGYNWHFNITNADNYTAQGSDATNISRNAKDKDWININDGT